MTDRFWAPWRMEYILGPKDGPCIFCDFASAPRDAYREKLVLVVQEHALVCLNRYPFASSHLLVAPRRHVSDFGSLPLPEYEAMQRLLRETAERLRRATGAEGLNVGFNLGKAAGAGIAEHLHGHVVPRWNGDTNFMPVLANVRVMPEYLDASWQRLAPFFTDLSGEPERSGTA
jgi:ATP adenylyltransferase